MAISHALFVHCRNCNAQATIDLGIQGGALKYLTLPQGWTLDRHYNGPVGAQFLILCKKADCQNSTFKPRAKP